jgi:hypothetical protein
MHESILDGANDMDEQYLTMILALPDKFFDGWIWHHCDFAINLDNVEKGRVTPLEEQFHTEFKIMYVDSIFKDTEWVFKDRVRPVPNQEQIQKMILDNQEKQTGNRYNDFKLLNLYNEYINSNIFKYVPVIYSAVELWLQYAALKIYNMKWDGEKWI